LTTHAARPNRPSPARAADEIAAFTRLFEERRAAEAEGEERGTVNAREMDLIAHAIQRHLEYIGRSWLEEAGDHGRPESLVALLAFGARPDYERHADQAIAQLREAEALYRTGDIDAAPMPSGRRRRRSRVRHSTRGRRFRIAALIIAVFAMWGIVLAACGSWGVVDDPQGVLTMTERTF
jgi:hypothetical protein